MYVCDDSFGLLVAVLGKRLFVINRDEISVFHLNPSFFLINYAQELSVQDVIDSDYPDISRLSILQVAGDDKLGRKVILFSACRLPAVDLIDHQRLLL
ncbi:Rho GTPase-activating protein 8 [Fasciolopsis buskii]|uniref:Rho GTPase-activating protein 8 n=1 Tax=Fasciolopsis buskii TaxID=27845 RepID=A0A8E0VM88_9TREM|nr:Rho GTPase-activating protein 8 [Fasciolopsis buski]